MLEYLERRVILHSSVGAADILENLWHTSENYIHLLSDIRVQEREEMGHKIL